MSPAQDAVSPVPDAVFAARDAVFAARDAVFVVDFVTSAALAPGHMSTCSGISHAACAVFTGDYTTNALP
ncbi:MAG: hypothetical protein GEV04_14165 [Actinophytocola sp.]|nr:hypothetical protein [Actinophytocola sp.]